MDSSDTGPPLLRPLPRRPFQLTSDSSSSDSNSTQSQSHSQPHAPPPHTVEQAQDLDASSNGNVSGSKSGMTRSTSIANLTSSTLFGIYAPSSFDSASQTPTPWGTGAETPAHRGSLDGFPSERGGFRGQELDERLLRDSLRTSGLDARRRRRSSVAKPTSPHGSHVARSGPSAAFAQLLRGMVLFACGLAYGALIAHLHDNRHVSPVRMEGLHREGWRYSAFWGCASVAMGLLLPWIDDVLAFRMDVPVPAKGTVSQPSVLTAVEWNDVVRSVGAFIGVAFAIRKTPWSSGLQLSLTLSLVNPFLWYLLDRSIAGLALSSASGILGILGILLFNPAWVPSPSHSLLSHANATLQHGLQSGVSDAFETFLNHERIGLAIWIGSVFFCSCICFGNIGRILAPVPR